MNVRAEALTLHRFKSDCPARYARPGLLRGRGYANLDFCAVERAERECVRAVFRVSGLVFRDSLWVVWAGVAQLVEHLICNQRVGGSNPFASSTSRGPGNGPETARVGRRAGVLSAGPVLRGDPTEVTCSDVPEGIRTGPDAPKGWFEGLGQGFRRRYLVAGVVGHRWPSG